MLLFCPSCSNLLTITPSSETGANQFECKTCPYQMPLDRRYFERKTFELENRDAASSGGGGDLLGGEESWKNVDRTEVQCPRDSCNSGVAYFRQVQIRSADEPMSSFYRCVECGHEWMEK